MSKKELGLDRQGIQLTMCQKDFWGYGAGVLGVTVITQLIGQLTYFYTDKIGMSAVVAGSALMTAKIADAFTDLIMGAIVDRTKSKHGKARPWMLWMSPLVILAVLGLLLVPKGWSSQAQFAYVLITNIFASAIICTAISVPFACLLNYRTRSQYERTRMNVSRTIFNYLGGMFFSVGLLPVTKAMGGTQKAWIIVGACAAVVASMSMLTCFFISKETGESSEAKAQKTEHFFTQVKSLFHNRYWVIMALAMLVAHIIYGFNSATNAYYAKWIFGSESIVGIMGIIAIIPTLLGFVIISPLVKRFGPLNVIKAGFLLGIIGYVIRVFFPYNFFVVCATGALTSMSTMPFMMTGMVLVASVSDFEEWKTGKRKVGLVQTATSFGGKAGSGFASGIIGMILTLGGYAPAAVVQTESAIRSIFTICIYLPAGLLLIMFVLMCLFDMDKKYPTFRQELIERTQKNNTDV
ncbi:MAG: MFS transporter [Faecousia sp.]